MAKKYLNLPADEINSRLALVKDLEKNKADKDDLDTLSLHVGDLSELKTQDKSSVVNAVNELYDKGGADIDFATLDEIDALFINVVEWVDLGLPSGLKWAKCNVGAENEYDPGLYFAWGETTGYAGDAGHDFSWENYKWSIDGSSSDFSKYNSTGATLELEDDAARANLGGSWRMPTKAEIAELINNTTQLWTDDYNGTGKAGYIVKSKTNSNQIFMPAAGSCSGPSLDSFGSDGGYWSSSQNTDYSNSGFGLYFSSGNFYRDYFNRYDGFSVRGVLPSTT